MARCTSKKDLTIHHVRRDGGNDIGNATVLCLPCHQATSTYGTPGTSPPAFTEETKKKALTNAGNQCQCTRTSGCH